MTPIPVTPPPIPTPPVQDMAGANPSFSAPGVEFGQKLNPADATQGTQAVGDVKKVEFKDGTNPLDQANGIRDEIARIRADYESQVASGQLKPGDGQVQVWRLMDLQTRAQDVHFRVELVTKLIDNVSGGIKQLSQTQA
jgi:hypothetical protein